MFRNARKEPILGAPSCWHLCGVCSHSPWIWGLYGILHNDHVMRNHHVFLWWFWELRFHFHDVFLDEGGVCGREHVLQFLEVADRQHRHVSCVLQLVWNLYVPIQNASEHSIQRWVHCWHSSIQQHPQVGQRDYPVRCGMHHRIPQSTLLVRACPWFQDNHLPWTWGPFRLDLHPWIQGDTIHGQVLSELPKWIGKHKGRIGSISAFHGLLFAEFEAIRLHPEHNRNSLDLVRVLWLLQSVHLSQDLIMQRVDLHSCGKHKSEAYLLLLAPSDELLLLMHLRIP